MSVELASLLENKRCGEAQVAARKAHIATLSGDEADGHKAALAREESDLAAITAYISTLPAAPVPDPAPAQKAKKK